METANPESWMSAISVAASVFGIGMLFDFLTIGAQPRVWRLFRRTVWDSVKDVSPMAIHSVAIGWAAKHISADESTREHNRLLALMPFAVAVSLVFNVTYVIGVAVTAAGRGKFNHTEAQIQQSIAQYPYVFPVMSISVMLLWMLAVLLIVWIPILATDHLRRAERWYKQKTGIRRPNPKLWWVIPYRIYAGVLWGLLLGPLIGIFVIAGHCVVFPEFRLAGIAILFGAILDVGAAYATGRFVLWADRLHPILQIGVGAIDLVFSALLFISVVIIAIIFFSLVYRDRADGQFMASIFIFPAITIILPSTIVWTLVVIAASLWISQIFVKATIGYVVSVVAPRPIRNYREDRIPDAEQDADTNEVDGDAAYPFTAIAAICSCVVLLRHLIQAFA